MMSGNTSMHIPDSIAGSLADFTGREWVFNRFGTWLQAEKPRTYLLTGPPGSGKSTIAARLVQISSGETPAIAYSPLRENSLSFYQFCQARFDSTLDPIRFIEALSKHLANQYQPFAHALLQNGEQGFTINASQTVGTAERGAEVRNVVIEKVYIGNRSARAAFDRAVRKPLEQLIAKDFHETILILVDSLDEALTYDSDDNIVTLLGRLTGDEADLPTQVRFLLTSRQNPQVENTIGPPSLNLVDDSPIDANDVYDYASTLLSALPEPRRQELAQWVTWSASGNFLYARYVVKALPADLDQVSDLSDLALPNDLEDIYRQFLKRELAHNPKYWNERYSPLLGVIAVTQGAGLTRTQLAGATKLAQSKTDGILQTCTQFLVGSLPNGPFRIYHQSFREFLLDDNEFPVYPIVANQSIAHFFLEEYEGKWLDCKDDYALRYTPTHLMEAIRQMAQNRVRQDLVDDLMTLLTDDDFLQTKATLLGVDMVLADLRMALEIALADNDLVRVINYAGIYRNTIRSQSIARAVFEAVQIGDFERAQQRTALYNVTPKPSREWEAILQLYIAWESAEQGNIEAVRKVMTEIERLPHFWNTELSDAFLVRISQTLARTTTDGRDARAWLTQWNFGRDPDELLKFYGLTQHLEEGELQASVAELNYRLAEFGQLVDEGHEAAASAVPFLDEETVGGQVGNLRKTLVMVAADPSGQAAIDRALQLVLPNPYPRYRDIALTALGVACLAVPVSSWVRGRLQSILRTALDNEGVIFTFDLPSMLVGEAQKRTLPEPELDNYLDWALNSNDRWGTGVRARSARAAALFRQGLTAEAIHELEEAATQPRGFAGYATVTLLSLASRWWEFGLSGSPSVQNLINESAFQADQVRDTQFREERIELVQMYRKWSLESAPDTEAVLATLSATPDPDTRRVYKDFISARWAGRVDGPNPEGLKALLPTALADGTMLDAILGRLFGLAIGQLSNADLFETIRLCRTHFTSNRPWELGQWR